MSRPLGPLCGGDEPGPGLVYLDANGTSYGPPDGYTKEDLLTALEGSKDILPLSGPIWMGWILTQTSFTDLDDKSIVLKSTVLFSYSKYRRPPAETNRGAAIPGLAGHKESR